MPLFSCKRSAAILYAATLLVGPMPAWSQQAAPHERKHREREQVAALEMVWRQAQLANDVTAMDKLLSDDYLGITANGEVVTKNQQLEHMRQRQLVINKLEMSDLKIKLIGQIAIVTSLARIVGSLDGDALNGNFRYTRVYQRLPSGVWKITNFEATRARGGNSGSQDP